MKLVLLFFCIILSIIISIILLLTLSTIKLNVKNIKISNLEGRCKKEKLEKSAEVYLELYIFGKIKILKIKINKRLIKKLNSKNNKQNIEKSAKLLKKVNILEIIKLLKIKTEKFNLNANIGTEEVTLTVLIITIISSILGNLFRTADNKNINYRIMPMYQYGNIINLRLNCIISVKMIHIIYIIYILFKKGMIKKEKQFNKRSYDYSYE